MGCVPNGTFLIVKFLLGCEGLAVPMATSRGFIASLALPKIEGIKGMSGRRRIGVPNGPFECYKGRRGARANGCRFIRPNERGGWRPAELD